MVKSNSLGDAIAQNLRRETFYVGSFKRPFDQPANGRSRASAAADTELPGSRN
jgi:hypothetical protein